MPKAISFQPSLLLTPDHKLILCGGDNNKDTCLELRNNDWKFHSSLNQQRKNAFGVSMKQGVFIFGGWDSPNTTWEWLPNGSSQWENGTNKIPYPGLDYGCGVKISENTMAFIGGLTSQNRLLTFNVDTKEWTNYGNVLKHGRYGHACVLFNDQIVIVGGYTGSEDLASTEVIDLQDLRTSTFSGNLNQARYGPGLVTHFGNIPTIAAIGGSIYKDGTNTYFDSIETWNETTGKWTTSTMKLVQPKFNFGYSSIPVNLVCS